MSLLKLPSLSSNPSCTMIFSTLNLCSAVGSLSFRAFLPRTTEKRRSLSWELKQHKVHSDRSKSLLLVSRHLPRFR